MFWGSADALCIPHFVRFIQIWRCSAISKQAHQVNDAIRDREVRVIDQHGEQLGLMSGREALEIAYDRDLDLVKISPGAKPPVCKIMDYGKFKFEQNKREKEAKKSQHIIEIKELRMSPVIDTNDFNVKLRSAHKFLKEGNRLKVTVRFRGRQMAHTNIGREMLIRFAAACEEIATLDKDPKLEGRAMSIFLSPRKAEKQGGGSKQKPASEKPVAVNPEMAKKLEKAMEMVSEPSVASNAPVEAVSNPPEVAKPAPTETPAPPAPRATSKGKSLEAAKMKHAVDDD